MALNDKSTTGTFDSGLLIADRVSGAEQSKSTGAGGKYLSCSLEFNSKTAVPMLPRMNAAEIAGLDNANTVTDDGMFLYDSDIDAPKFKMGGAWESITTLALTPVSQKITILDQADILALNGTPVELVPAPGVGLLRVILKVSLVNAFETAAFAGGSDVVITYSDGTTYATDRLIPLLFMRSGVVSLYTTGGVVDNILATGAGVNIAGLVNSPVLMQNFDQATAFTGGNVQSKIIVNVCYMTVVMQ